MHTFQIWAPTPKKVELQYGEMRIPMVPDPDGWWTAEASLQPQEAEYGFVLDDQGPFPDPRSAWQRQGIHGLSSRYHLRNFPWTDSYWQAPPLSSALIYELHIGTFTPAGTFEAAIERLDHLVELGITHVELMPVNEFSGRHGWGYDGVYLYAPHQAYGGPLGLQRLVDACHGKGLAVLLDVVYNHLGPVGNYLSRFGPYFTQRHSTPWGAAVNFDGPDNYEVRRFFIDNAVMWLRDYHLDGLRLDAVHAIADTSAVPFLEQLADEVRQLEAQLGRHLVLIAESDLNDPRLLWPRERGGFGLDAQWSDDFHHALHAVLTGENKGYYADFGTLAQLAKALERGFVYDGIYSNYRRRHHGRRASDLSGARFLAYLQNHDQVGNRACGERSSHLLSIPQLKVAATFIFTSAFVPMLFQGEEWGASTPFLYFTDHEEAQLAQAVSEGRRREFADFGWKPEDVPDPQEPKTFQRSKLNWSELAREPHAGLLDWYRQLIALRRTERSLSNGKLDGVTVFFDDQARWLVMERGSMNVVFNLADKPQKVQVRQGIHEVRLASEPRIQLAKDHAELPAHSAVIFKTVNLPRHHHEDRLASP